MPKLAIAAVIAFVVLALFWATLHFFWARIPRRAARDDASGDMASALAALIRETREALESGSLDGETLVSVAAELRRLHERSLERAGSIHSGDLVNEIRADKALAGLLDGFNPGHLRQLEEIIATAISDPQVSDSDKHTLHALRTALRRLTS